MRLVYFLQKGLYSVYEHTLPTASSYDIRHAVGYCAGYPRYAEELSRLIAHPNCPSLTKEFLAFLTYTPPVSMQQLLNAVQFELPDTDTLLHVLNTTPLAYPESLRIVLRHPRFVDRLYELTGKQIARTSFLSGWGVADFLLEQEARKAECQEILVQERLHRRAHNLRVMFWASVLLLRIRDFQARYWGEGGKGYLAAQQRFVAAQAQAQNLNRAKSI